MPRRELTFLFGQFVPRCTHRIDKHFTDYFVIQYVHGGRVSLSVGADSFELDGRWFFSSYPGPRISFKPSAVVGTGRSAAPTWVHRYLAFKGPAVDRFVKEGLFPVPPMAAPPREDFAARFDTLLELSRREDVWGQRRAGLELERLLCELAEARAHAASEASDGQTEVEGGGKAAARPSWVTIARARLEVLGPPDIDYDRLATELGVSSRTFRREFTKRIGLPPHQYLVSARISHARELLAHTDLPLKEIARELGYSDVFYFSRQFRKTVGVPPGMFRRSREG